MIADRHGKFHSFVAFSCFFFRNFSAHRAFKPGGVAIALQPVLVGASLASTMGPEPNEALALTVAFATPVGSSGR